MTSSAAPPNEAPPDPIHAIDPALPSSVMALVALAERETLKLNENPPQVASLEVLARRLLRAEAVASWIEGVQLSNRRLARAEAEDASSRGVTAKAVLGNVAAVERIVALADSENRLTLEDLLGVHRALMELTPDARGAGELREHQNWIEARECWGRAVGGLAEAGFEVRRVVNRSAEPDHAQVRLRPLQLLENLASPMRQSFRPRPRRDRPLGGRWLAQPTDSVRSVSLRANVHPDRPERSLEARTGLC